MMMRFDPFRDLDRLFDAASGGAAAPRPLPMNAVRRGDSLEVTFDVPGVSADAIDLTVERNQLVLTVERGIDEREGDDWLVRERPTGRFTRQLVLGDNLDTERLEAEYHDGVLRLSIPVAEEAKPRKVSISANGHQSEAIEAESVSS